MSCGRWFRGTRACSRCWNSGLSAISKSVPATSPGSVYWPRSSATSLRWQEGTPWVAELSSMPDGRLRWLDRVAGHRDATPPGSLSTQPVATRWLSPESTNRKQSLVRCLPARPASAFAVNADEQQELYRRAASTRTEWNHGPYRRHGRSHGTTLPPSSGATCRSAAPWKACPVFLVP